MVEFVPQIPPVLSDAQRVDFVCNHFTNCLAGERPCRGLVVDMENGHYVKLVVLDTPDCNQFAIKHYIKGEKGDFITIPADVLKSLYPVASVLCPYTPNKFSRFDTLDKAAKYLKIVAELPRTPYVKIPLKDPTFVPPIYPSLPWVSSPRVHGF